MWLCVLSYTSIFSFEYCRLYFSKFTILSKKNILKVIILNSLKGFWIFLSDNQNLMIILNQNDMFMQRYTCRSKPQSWNEMTWLTHTHIAELEDLSKNYEHWVENSKISQTDRQTHTQSDFLSSCRSQEEWGHGILFVKWISLIGRELPNIFFSTLLSIVDIQLHNSF